MRLISFEADGREQPGAVVTGPDGTDRVVALGDLSLAQILEHGPRIAAAAGSADITALPTLTEVKLAPPVRPGKILCLGYNYAGHTQEQAPPFPNVFIKTPNTICGPGDAVVMPPSCTDVDYEGEIAVVIGTRASRVPQAGAMAHVAGYTLFNDVSDRGWQHRTDQWALGKSADGFGPLGPWIVTTDEVTGLGGRTVEVERNGVVTVSASTDAMVYDVAFLVHYLSQIITLEPGDIISTGTPGRFPQAQAAHTPLTPGDTVTIRVTGLGELTTPFVSMEENR
ncbi:fumarylacetoacetate hydrolase family protein [Kineosporia sp. NBRC 101731]|uniref:fumarylacetoacetate hydrolase family protein n=1 Tax=Kineosporia sp. NBRC 101731 TaxID=3032199 RepID=UPI0024A207A5|nr:fumarylacetoacetate hydrolase family protein [Kineosporia sp. NBRC 101731]GLY31494.1 5-oxopent-3-ene-1,2,5-tricarboxylate decarboxylase [Kineosporia sp. NBRC 101731]